MSEHNKPKVSIILPCYNMEKYLNRCVESILNNSYRPIEIILVNDGSIDATPQIINELEAKHCEIVAIHKQNGGVSSARNAGIEAATGDFLMFVDPDDYVEENFISAPVEKAIAKDADLVLFGYKTAWYSNPPVLQDYYPIEEYDLNDQTEIFSILFPRFFGMTKQRFEQWLANNSGWEKEKELPSACRFLYRREFIKVNSLRFKDLKLGEDATFVWDCLLKADRIATTMAAAYVYIPLQQGALATTTSTNKLLESKLKVLAQRNRIAEEIEHQRGMDINNLYAGSNILCALQIGLALAAGGHYSDWKQFLNDKHVRKSTTRLPITYRGGVKRWLPVLLLKYRAHLLLFLAFKLALKLKITPDVW